MNVFTMPLRKRGTRRPVAVRLGAVAVAAALATVLAACGGSPDAAGSGGGAGSTLTIGYDSDPAPTGYDPLRYSPGQRQFYESLYDSLFVQTADGGVEPGLVADFSYSADNTQLTLTLRDGVTFADGSPLDATLVKANLDRRADPELTSYTAFAPGGEAEIVDVQAPDPRTVVITTATPQASLHILLTGVPGMIVGPTGVADPASLATTPDGSGPYTLDADATIKGSSYVVVEKPGHPDAAGHPFDTVVHKAILDGQARANAMVSGQVDAALLTPDAVDLVESRGVAIERVGGTVVNLAVFDKTGAIHPAFGDVRVRQAIQHAIDRETLVATLHEGDEPTANAFPAAAEGHDPALDAQWGHDPQRARELLAEAGYADGFSFDVVTSPPTMTDMQAIQAQLAEVGITMNVRTAASTEELFASVETQPLGYFPLSWTDPLGIVQGVVVGGFLNLQQASDPAISDALGRAAAATGDARAEALTDLNAALVAQGWMIPLYESYSYWAYDADTLQKVTFSGTDQYPLLAAFRPTT
ncbi:ABC transporter substrate-binding protein [Pseudonocardia nigra]|uniref:ABC transporter substrate-binding protein n=1 Tax=Pseudonocardia nigra TaxID=1921578 RepID=UPI001C5D4820|nr:ABC transporter substrate-binding protein [Pseudonocardia nigra]